MSTLEEVNNAYTAMWDAYMVMNCYQAGTQANRDAYVEARERWVVAFTAHHGVAPEVK